jgi:predicted metalloprotease with PDZ domain
MRSRRPVRASSAAALASLLTLPLACRAPAAPAPSPPPRTEPSEPAAPIHYTLELVDPATPLVAVHVEVAGDVDGESDFTLSEGWGGVVETGRDLELVEARGAGGALEHERIDAHTWRVRHGAGERLALVFELAPTAHRASGPPEYYLPILESDLLHALGAATLPAPAHLDGGLERPITLAWRGFEEAGWSTISSFGAAAELATARALDSFRHALFLAGTRDSLRLVRHDVHGRPLWIAVHGAWSFRDEEFTQLAARIVALGREFFADFDQPFYLVSLIGVGAADARGSSYGGTGLTDSFALFLSPNMTLARMPGGGGVTWLLAHELFHEWNGHAITLAQPEQLGYWFSEGFTDFYARRLLQRAGLVDEEGWLESWNHKLAVHAANPERHAPAERVRAAFWTDHAVGEVPYQRGDLIALYVDHAIRTRSGGERSLDDLMRTLVARARAGALPCDTAALSAAIGELAGAEVGEVVRRWAVDGVEPPLPTDALGPEYELVPADIPTFDTGFDHEAAMRDGVVAGVRPGGCAERAGLRDGMALASWSVNFGAVDQPIEMRVKSGDEERTLAYLPHGAPARGYRAQRRGP